MYNVCNVVIPVTPTCRYFADLLRPRFQGLPHVKCNKYYELLDSVNQRKWHFFTLNSISHFSSYNSNFFRSFWRVSASTCDHMVTCRYMYIRKSSANRRTVESDYDSGRSFMYIVQ